MTGDNDITDVDDNADIPGYRWVSFRGGSLDGEQRLIREPIVDGDRYNRLVPNDQTWQYNPTSGEFELL